jgi:hypothetical protein
MLLTAQTDSDRRQTLDRYLDFLRARDGALDVEAHRLSRREEFFRRIDAEPVRWKGPVDVERFHRNHVSAQAEPGLPPELLFLLICAKANRSERYGVDLSFKLRNRERWRAHPADGYIEVEEFYHTRILIDLLKCFGLEVTMRPPAVAARAAILSMAMLPKPMAMPVILAAEVVGSVAFRLLLEKSKTLFAAQPEVARRCEELLQQILIDELGHVTYCKANLGGLGMSATRVMLDGIMRALLADVPEFAMLFGQAEIAKRVREFDLGELAAGLPERPFLVA